MNPYYILLVIFLIPVVIVVSYVIDYFSQSPFDYKERIEKELSKKGYKLVDIKMPGMFKTGPFPIFQLNFSVQTRVMGKQGEKVRYRIVKYKNKKGRIRQSWIKISVTAFLIIKIQWIPDI